MMTQSLKFLIYGSLGLLTALYISGCEPSLPKNTQVYEINGAQVCDAQRQTPDLRDDCDNHTGAAGYYYNPGNSTVFYRAGSGKSIIVERNVPRSPGATVGGSVPLSKSIITNQSGTPLMDNNGSIVRSPSRSSPSINTAPVRSTASFDAPGVRVNAGKTSGASRGMSFGSSNSGSGRLGG
ncbi:hypothetical protein [Leptolyngbya ohadii]|uniref:hypothetical protein n=1 Tax=Leptolyngbya ohadii TaxID=1962290 RepID=UPI000B59E6BF|nr:hypothetical protein [Leptolyngbya ohadii]